MKINHQLNPEKNSFAIDFSSTTLRLAKIERKRKHFSVVTLSDVDYDEKAFYGNRIEDEDAIANNISLLINNAEGKKVNTKFVSLTLSDEKAFIKVIKTPKLSAKDLSSAIFFEAENHLPLPMGDAYFDYSILSSSTAGAVKNNHHVLITAIPKTVADAYVRSVEKAGLFPVSLEINVFSLLRLLSGEYIQDTPVLLISTTQEKITYTICSYEAVWFTFSSPLTEIERESRESLQSKMIVDIEKYIDYFDKNIREEGDIKMRIKKVIICKSNFNAKNAYKELEIKTGIGVSSIGDFSKIKCDLPSFKEKERDFTTVMGLALKHIT